MYGDERVRYSIVRLDDSKVCQSDVAVSSIESRSPQISGEMPTQYVIHKVYDISCLLYVQL